MDTANKTWAVSTSIKPYFEIKFFIRSAQDKLTDRAN